MVKDIKCDIFKSGTEVIIHQANCQCTMGSGIALALKNKWPQVYEADCETKRGDYKKLGTFSIATIDQGTVKWVFNCYSQFYYGREHRHTNYEAFYKCLVAIKEMLETSDIKIIAAPYKMGCNLAGGDWRIVRPMFDVVFENSPLTILICDNEKINL